jgi:hypothetical protein
VTKILKIYNRSSTPLFLEGKTINPYSSELVLCSYDRNIKSLEANKIISVFEVEDNKEQPSDQQVTKTARSRRQSNNQQVDANVTNNSEEKDNSTENIGHGSVLDAYAEATLANK